MKKSKYFILLALLLIVGLVLAACGGGNDKDNTDNAGGEGEDTFSIAMVTDQGGVDDKSFNQSAWEGFKAFGEENGLEKGDGGYDYLQSAGDADYIPNLNQMIRRDFDLIYGVGFLLQQPIEEIAKQKPEQHFAIVDSVVEADNVVSIMFKEQEAGFLAGVAAAMQTETKKIGFVGGMESDVIERFEAGYKAGVRSVDPSIEILVQYVGSFTDANGGKAKANLMYSGGADIIFAAAGGSGNGVFAEAKERKQNDADANIWVIGVDSDQYDEGTVGEHNVTLTSALKRVDVGVKDTATKAMNGEFPGGETVTYGLAEEGVDLATTGDHLSDEILAKVDEYKQQIINGEIVVPGTFEELDQFGK